MDIEEIRNVCCGFPGVTEDIKWQDHLAFSVGGKIFCLADLEAPFLFAFKVTEDDFFELTESGVAEQAPHFAKKMWVKTANTDGLSSDQWKEYIRKSYDLVRMKLPGKMKNSLK